MILRHQRDGFGLEYLLSVMAAALEDHLDKGQIVGSRRVEAAAATMKICVRRNEFHIKRRERSIFTAPVDTDRASILFCGTDKAGVRHAQRLKHILGQIVTQGLAADGLDQLADPIGANAVFPAFSRLTHQRHTEGGFFAAGNTWFAGCLLVLAQAGVPDFIAKAGRMGQKLTRGDGSFGRAELRLSRSVKAFQHLKLSQGWQDVAQGLIQAEFALFVELHGRNRGDRFGHGGDAKDGIGGHGRAGIELARAERVLVDRPGVRGHGGNHTRNITRLYRLIQNGINLLHGFPFLSFLSIRCDFDGNGLARLHPAHPWPRKAQPGQPVFIVIGFAHAFDDSRVRKNLGGAGKRRTVPTPDGNPHRGAPVQNPFGFIGAWGSGQIDHLVGVPEPDRRGAAPLAALALGRKIDFLGRVKPGNRALIKRMNHARHESDQAEREQDKQRGKGRHHFFSFFSRSRKNCMFNSSLSPSHRARCEWSAISSSVRG